MAPSARLAIGQIVRYPDPPVVDPEYIDEYRNFFNLTAAPNTPRLIMNRGIDRPALTEASDGKRRAVILIRSNPIQAGTTKTPWHDVFNMRERRLTYYGDHKVNTVQPLGSTLGNASLLETAEAHEANSKSARSLAVPLLVFRTVEVGNQTKGYVEFCGLGVIEQFQAIQQVDPPTGTQYPNYVYEIRFLDLAAEGDQLDWRWINARRDPSLSIEQANALAPSSWLAWVDTGQVRFEKNGQPDPDDTENKPKSPDWAWDEIVLACALTYKNDWREVKRSDPRAMELSDLLQLLPVHPHWARGDDFRNFNSVQRKTADIATAHPSYRGKATRGGQLTRQVVNEFIKNPERMLATADQIKNTIASEDTALIEKIAQTSTAEEDVSADEGQVLERLHRVRERDPGLRRAKIRASATLACEACDFDFSKQYGTHGEGYIEVHHIVPLHQAGPSKTRLADLALLCSNCHRMSHRRLNSTGAWPTPQELRHIVAVQVRTPRSTSD
ncbi:HNH endonuclease [Actinomadura sp. 9N407]|uniref:HNH endonuclease n=1 Tax=Actinomadura sp. 9N407 TaxID=3375154 RepID=UPI003787402E